MSVINTKDRIMLPYIFICRGCGTSRRTDRTDRTDLPSTMFCSKRCQQQYYRNKFMVKESYFKLRLPFLWCLYRQ